MRINKYIAHAGVASRRKAEELIKQGLVTVNGQVVRELATTIKSGDKVEVEGQPIYNEEKVYYLLNKPKGVISATEDDHHQTVLDLLDDTARRKEVFPVGRLDIDTHGLLLLTNNGKLAHAMLSPKKHVSKNYRAQVAGIMDEADVARFEEGIALKDFTTLPARLQILEVNEANDSSYVEIEIAEGKFHQVKRMVAACGKEVVDLQRLTMGTLVLDENMQRGEWRRLTKEELEVLLASIA